MDKNVKQALDRINELREKWIENFSDLDDKDLDITAEDQYWTIRKWLYRMIDHEAIHVGQIVKTRRSIEPVWKTAVRWREIDRIIGELYRLRGQLASELVGLSDELFNTSPDEDKWSIKEILEHLANAELFYVKQIEKLKNKDK
ncbi:hypothetical protein GF312_03355 [Candidatus Poribacteria bacterium]|nr:hypothetical protein [Candidatus Poribacteria bacterium]